MRVLTALDYAAESSESSYIATALSKAATIPHLEAYIVHTYENAAKSTMRMPEYFRSRGYKSPTDGSDGPFQFAQETSLPYFDYLHADPVRSDRFNICMNGNKGLRRHWVDWYPVQNELLNRSREGEVLLVDMGGGNGKHLEVFLRKFPGETKGRLILQDLPGTIKALAGLDEGIRPMVHDIFEAQPVKGRHLPPPPLSLTFTLSIPFAVLAMILTDTVIKTGAKAYYTHFLLHDFPDDKCRDMLRHVASSMEPGYSRILLNEIVLPSVACPSFFAAADITMMAVLAGQQRTKEQWVKLVESAGLTVVKVWKSPDVGDFEGIVEAMVGPKGE